MSYGEFLAHFQVVFHHPDQGQSASQRLLSLLQGSSAVSDYAIKFQILAALRCWNEPVLIAAFHNRLSSAIQTLLASHDEGLSLNSLITLAITLNQHLRGKARHSTSATVSMPILRLSARTSSSLPLPSSPPANEPAQEPMQLGSSQVPARVESCLYSYSASGDQNLRSCLPACGKESV